MTSALTETEAPERELKDGRVVAIAGPVVDVEFPPDALPEITHALEMDVELEGHKTTITARLRAENQTRSGVAASFFTISD